MGTEIRRPEILALEQQGHIIFGSDRIAHRIAEIKAREVPPASEAFIGHKCNRFELPVKRNQSRVRIGNDLLEPRRATASQAMQAPQFGFEQRRPAKETRRGGNCGDKRISLILPPNDRNERGAVDRERVAHGSPVAPS